MGKNNLPPVCVHYSDIATVYYILSQKEYHISCTTTSPTLPHPKNHTVLIFEQKLGLELFNTSLT